MTEGLMGQPFLNGIQKSMASWVGTNNLVFYCVYNTPSLFVRTRSVALSKHYTN